MRKYVVQVRTGSEIEVRDYLQEQDIPAWVPRESRSIRQGGAWREKVYVLFPGYVFVGAVELTPEIYYAVKDAPNVLHFLGTPGPEPISYLEAEYIGILAPNNEPLRPSVAEVLPDGSLRPKEGVLAQLIGQVTDVNPRQRRVTIRTPLLGADRTVDISFVTPDGETEKEAAEPLETEVPAE